MKAHFRRILLLSLYVSLLGAATAIVTRGQTPFAPFKPPAWTPARAAGDDSEKSISADKNVNLTLCVNEAGLKVNGWSRNEVRVFVRGGSRFMFKVQAKGASGLPGLLNVYGYNVKSKYPAYTDCISGEEIEIDAPVGATINIKGREVRTVIDTVRKASVNTIGGDIILRNITESVWASTGQGDITVEGSQGPMTLSTTTGNVVVFDARPHDIGDVFKAKTNGGNLSLQDIAFRQLEVNSISGSILYAGEIPEGAAFGIGTTNGSIRLQIPEKLSFQLTGIFTSGHFTSEVPFKIISEDVREGSVKTIQAKFGMGGQSSVKLTSSLGVIGIKKL